jgi:hypothetical protein
MGFVDVVLLGLLASLLGAALTLDREWIRSLAALTLWSAVVVSCVLMRLLHRAVREPGGNSSTWADGFSSGVAAMAHAISPYLVYLIVAATGLAVLAVRRRQ